MTTFCAVWCRIWLRHQEGSFMERIVAIISVNNKKKLCWKILLYELLSRKGKKGVQTFADATETSVTLDCLAKDNTPEHK